MRTTLTLDDVLMRRLKSAAVEQGIPLKQLIDRVLRLGLERVGEPRRHSRYRCPTFAMGTPRTANLDKALSLASDLEDDEILRKLELRK